MKKTTRLSAAALLGSTMLTGAALAADLTPAEKEQIVQDVLNELSALGYDQSELGYTAAVKIDEDDGEVEVEGIGEGIELDFEFILGEGGLTMIEGDVELDDGETEIEREYEDGVLVYEEIDDEDDEDDDDDDDDDEDEDDEDDEDEDDEEDDEDDEDDEDESDESDESDDDEGSEEG